MGGTLIITQDAIDMYDNNGGLGLAKHTLHVWLMMVAKDKGADKTQWLILVDEKSRMEACRDTEQKENVTSI